MIWFDKIWYDLKKYDIIWYEIMWYSGTGLGQKKLKKSKSVKIDYTGLSEAEIAVQKYKFLWQLLWLLITLFYLFMWLKCFFGTIIDTFDYF